jgi:hypothetical protein
LHTLHGSLGRDDVVLVGTPFSIELLPSSQMSMHVIHLVSRSDGNGSTAKRQVLSDRIDQGALLQLHPMQFGEQLWW